MTSRAPAVTALLAAIVSVQFGGALAATLLPMVGVAGSVCLRLTLAAVLLLVVARPRLSGHPRAHWLTVLLFAVSLAAMNTAFYGSLARLPIGVAVTIEFVGPLLLAASAGLDRSNVGAVVLAAAGVVLVSGTWRADWAQLDLLGVGLALLAGACWAAYIVLSQRTGARFPGLDGIAVAMVLAAGMMLPFGIASAGQDLFRGDALLRGAGIAILSSALPYSLELVALRTLPRNVFGILLSLEPAMAGLAGFLLLHQRLDGGQLAGMVCVIIASAVVLGRRTPAVTAP